MLYTNIHGNAKLLFWIKATKKNDMNQQNLNDV